MFFFKNHAENGAETSSRPPLPFQKKKTSGQYLSFDIFWYSTTWTYNKNKLYKISDC